MLFKKNSFKSTIASSIMLLCTGTLVAQITEEDNKGVVTGNIRIEAAYYLEDSLIGANEVPERFGSNMYGNINYRYGKFSAGMRYEAYLPPLVGFDSRYKGNGIANRFLNYTDSKFQLTLGSFYEQFGSGSILRTYEDKYLGIDNALDGFRLVFTPIEALTVKTFIARQKNYWDYGNGTIRGADAEWNILRTFSPESIKTLIMGFSAVSRYQADEDPIYIFPENVAAFSGRLSYSGNSLALSGEYSFKINDPSAINNLIYKNGQSLIFSGSYSTKGLGISLTTKYVDNMDFRSERGATSNDLTLNFLPPSARAHTYSFAAMYPYATQPLGEASLVATVNYMIPKGSTLGGKYGTMVTASASLANSIEKSVVNDTTSLNQSGTDGYKSTFGKIGDEKYFRDYTLEISRKFSSTFKATLGGAIQYYNITVIQGHPGAEAVETAVFWIDLSKRIDEQNFRIEAQHLSTKQDKGNWVMLLAEYTIAPKWFIALSDQYNYGNDNKDLRKHYFLVSGGFNLDAHRLSISFGKQNEGMLCVGGVCRTVPATYSVGLTYSTTF